MARWLLAGGAAAALIGGGLAVPVIVAHIELQLPAGYSHFEQAGFVALFRSA